MSIDSETEYIDALIDLHRGIERKGPGDNAFSLNILSTLSTLPSHPQIADLGCGSGAGALLLAQYYQSPVMAVDFALGFIDELKIRAKQCELEHLIKPIHGDMAKLDWADGSIDLLWSEGAAYNLGFEQALTIWRSLLTNTGLAVISEMSWFSDHVPEPAALYWQKAYPRIANEAENSDRAHRSGFKVISTHRLPSQAWWQNYYEPLREQMRQVEISPVMQLVIDEIEEEMNLFERFSDFYGYAFYVLQVLQ